MKILLNPNYTKRILVAFLITLLIALVVNLLGNAWIYNAKHNGDREGVLASIFALNNLLWLFYQLIRDILISSVLLFSLSKLLNEKVSFASFIYTTTLAELVFIGRDIFDLVWTYTHHFGLNRTINFQSLSVYSCITKIPSYLFYAATTCNLWEIAYMVILSLLLKVKLKRSFTNTLGLVFLFYGLPLILWMVWVTFIEINRI